MAEEWMIQKLQQESQIRYQKLERDYQYAIHSLENEYQLQVARYRASLQQMTREQQARQEQRIRNEIAALRRETELRLREQEYERQRKLEELQQYYQAELERLVERLQEDEAAELHYAEAQRKAAEDAFRSLSQDPVAQKFLPQAAEQAKNRLDSAETLFQQRLFTLAAARWFTVSVSCASDLMEAKEIQKRWEARRSAAEERLVSIENMLRERLETAHTYKHSSGISQETPAAWIDQEPRTTRLRESLAKARESYEHAAPGETESFDWVELATFGAEDEIEALERISLYKIRNFLCCLEMQHYFFKSAGSGWTVTEGGFIERYNNHGEMTLSDGLYDRVMVEIFPKTDDRNIFVLISRYMGHKADIILRRRLEEIINTFAEVIAVPQCCGMQIDTTNEFLDEGYPAVRLELRLMTGREDAPVQVVTGDARDQQPRETRYERPAYGDVPVQASDNRDERAVNTLRRE